jgi:ferredoxin-NADP reductase
MNPFRCIAKVFLFRGAILIPDLPVALLNWDEWTQFFSCGSIKRIKSNFGQTLAMAIELKIKKIEQHTEDFKTFELEAQHPLPYKAGQYLTLTMDTLTGEERRSYSMVSAPETDENIKIGVKRIPNGLFSRMLFDEVKTGDILTCSGTGGLFTLPDTIEEDVEFYFFAAGSGITPFISLLKSGLTRFPHFRASLFYSNRSEDVTAFRNELLAMRNQFPERFHLEFLFSNTPDLREARLDRERLLKIISGVKHKEKTYFYICGPAAYMRMIHFILVENGIPKKNIRKEDFLPVRTHAFIPEPPDQTTRKVILHYKGQQYKFEVVYPDTILRAAKKLKISLPYSCETGKCGNCLAKIIHGKVWMNNNEVLLDSDIAKGLTLTCTGHPIEGDVELQIGGG